MEWFEKNFTAGHFEHLFNSLDAAIFFIDAESRILRTNEAFRRVLGYGRDEISSMVFTDIYVLRDSFADIYQEQPDNIVASFKLYYFNLASKQALPIKLLDRDGKMIPATFKSVLFEDPGPGGVYGVGIALWKKTVSDDAVEDAARQAQRVWELEQNYQNVLKSSGDAIVITDFNGWIVNVNDAFLAMLGYESADAVIGRYLIEFVPIREGDFPCSTGETLTVTKAWQDEHVDHIDTLFATGMVTFESYMVHRDGTHIPIDATMTMLRDQAGERRGTVAIFKDITGRRKAQLELMQAKSFLENVFETTGDGIYVTDSLGLIKMVNGSFCEITGYREDELIGKYAVELLPDHEYQGLSSEGFDGMFAENYFSEFEDMWQKKDGTLFPVEAKIAVLRTCSGDDDGLVGSIRDITGRKRAEEQLQKAAAEVKRSRDFLDNVFNTTGDGIYVTDDMGTIIAVNRALCDMMGYTRDELVGRAAVDFTADIGDDPRYAGMVESMFSMDYSSRFEALYQRKDGTIFPVESNIANLHTGTGPGAAIIVSVRDISERKEFERRLREAHDELEKKVEERTKTLTETNVALKVLLERREEDKKSLENGMVHNINELVMPHLERLKTCRLNDRQRSYIEIIESNLKELIAPLQKKDINLSLTPMELQVANLVRQGKTTKDISDILNIGLKTVNFHRDNLRKKMGLKKSKVSLREHLSSVR